MPKPKIDPITFEVIRNALLSSAAEMKVVVMRASYSPLWREGGDLSCGLLTPEAELVAQGPADLPCHLATMPFSLRGAVSRIPLNRLEREDVLFHNTPEWGNNHLPDCLMAKPLFFKNEIVAFSAVRGHWSDIGGIGPGSYSTITTDYLQEGLRIPPVKIYKKGQLDEELVEMILANTRARSQRLGDLRAQYAGCVVGERKVLALLKKYGKDTVVSCMKEILNHSERLTRAEIQKIPDGTYSYTDYCDGDGVVDEPIKIQVALTVKGSNVTVDFTGSDEQVIGGMNAPLAVTTSSVEFAIKAATDHWNPTNSGCYRPVKIVAPEGTVVNPRLPASVVAANHETAMTIVAAVFGALDQASADNPERVTAAGSGSSVPIVFGGNDTKLSKKGRYYVFHFVQGGAWGARYDKDGISALRDGVGNTGNTPVEVVETEYPIMFESYELVPDGGGPGKFRGGLPARSIFKTLGDSTLTVTAERGRFAPYGLRGGKSAVKARFILNPGTDKEKVLFSKVGPVGLKAGDVLSAHSAGGGGFGNPLERDPSLVQRDVIDGYVSLKSAEEDYGVVLNPETYEIVRLNREK